jgi:hypothetical protein
MTRRKIREERYDARMRLNEERLEGRVSFFIFGVGWVLGGEGEREEGERREVSDGADSQQLFCVATH